MFLIDALDAPAPCSSSLLDSPLPPITMPADRRYAPLGGGAKTSRTRLLALFGAVFIGTLVLLTHPPGTFNPWTKVSPVSTAASRADAAREAFVAFARSFPQIDTSHARVLDKEEEEAGGAGTTGTGTEVRRAAAATKAVARDVEGDDEDDDDGADDDDDEEEDEDSSSSTLPPPRTRRLNTPRTRPVPDNYYVARLRDGRTEFDWSSTRRLFVLCVLVVRRAC